MRRKEWPEKDELVVCTVKEIKAFGAFVTLEEYKGKEGLIHISEIAPGWVKHVRDYVKEGQRIVCKVLNVDKKKGHIDLSLKDVKASQKKEKIKIWKNEEKAKKWLSIAASRVNVSEEGVKEVEMRLEDAYGGLYEAFEEIVKRGKGVLEEIVVEERFADEIYNVAVANVKLPTVHITGYVELQCPLPNGV
ncbi:MAG: translation initiation factor IF-2 subunit alpha, partial [Candidatus Methanospirareceae archaeon]